MHGRRTEGEGRKASDAPVVIKKYANRRLYNTATSSYVTLDSLCEMVKEGVEFTVHDAKSGEDLTRAVLTQIIFEEENKTGQYLLPIRFLRQLIRFYGDQMQSFIPSYLEMSMEAFSRNQEAWRARMADTFGPKAVFKEFEELTRHNLSLYERAVRMFSPFKGAEGAAAHDEADAASPGAGEPAEELRDLQAKLAQMQKQIDALARKGRG